MGSPSTRLTLASCLGAWLLAPTSAAAEVIHVVPTDDPEDNYAKMEAAGPGDEVVVAPGTYRFRLYLEGQGTEQQPIVIRAEDPANRPIWDFDGDIIADIVGSYDAGDKGRAMWQFTGSHYRVSGIVFKNGTDGGLGDGGGIRFKLADNVTLHDCLFQFNDNGIQGAGNDILVEFCEFDRNGQPGSTDGCHSMYMQGGTLIVRYCYIHDARRSQNFHLRTNRAVLEYNWITRAHSYMGDMMPCTMDPCDAEQHLLLRGNVILRGTPTNDGQVMVMYNDKRSGSDPTVGFHMTLVNNTIIGNGDDAALVHIANDDPKVSVQTARLDNNLIYDVARIFRVDDAGQANWSTGGTHNWVSEGTSDTMGLQNTVVGVDPQLTDLSGAAFVPLVGSPLVDAADPSVPDLPDKEYFRDEVLTMHWRARATVLDIGAFESTTSTPAVGAYDATPNGSDGGGSEDGAVPDDGVPDDGAPHDGAPADGWSPGDDDTPAPEKRNGVSGGCSCAARSSTSFWLLFPLVLWRRRRAA
ncbi:hypothetical protein ACFL6C_03230 [Myxococcota bacterium]